MRFFIKAKTTKYIKRWKGKDGKWNYKYPPKGKPSAVKEAKPERKMVIKEEPGKAPAMSPDGEVYITSFEGDTVSRLKVPKKFVEEIFEWKGMKFALHRRVNAHTLDAEDQFVVTELSSGSLASKGEIDASAKDAKKGALKSFESLGVAKVVKSVAKNKKHNGANVWELEDAYNSVDEIIHLNDPERITGIAKKIINQVDALEEEDDLNSVEAWVKEYLDDELKEDPSDLVDGTYSEYVLDVAIRGVGEEMESMDLADAEQTIDFLTAVQDVLAHDGYDKDFHEIATWAQKATVDMSFIGEDLSDWEVGTEDGGGTYLSISSVINVAMANDVSPQSIVEEYEVGEVEGDVEIAGATWDSTSLAALGGWVGGHSVKRTRGAIIRQDLKGFPKDLKKKLGMDFFEDEYVDDMAPTIDMLTENSVEIDDDTLYRGTENKAWTKMEPGEVMVAGAVSFSRKQSSGFGGISLELVKPPPLHGVSVEDIIDDNKDVAAYYNIDTHSSEREVIVRAPFLQVIEKSGTVVKVKVIADPQEVLAMAKAQDELFSDKNKSTKLPIIIRDDPKIHAQLQADLNRPLSKRGEKKKK